MPWITVSRPGKSAQVALGDAAAMPAVKPDRVDLVKICHCAEAVGDVANLADWGDVAVHRIDRFEADELRALGRQSGKQFSQVLGVVVPEDDPIGGPALLRMPKLIIEGVVHRLRQHDASPACCRASVDKAASLATKPEVEDKRRLAPVEVGKLPL